MEKKNVPKYQCRFEHDTTITIRGKDYCFKRNSVVGIEDEDVLYYYITIPYDKDCNEFGFMTIGKESPKKYGFIIEPYKEM